MNISTLIALCCPWCKSNVKRTSQSFDIAAKNVSKKVVSRSSDNDGDSDEVDISDVKLFNGDENHDLKCLNSSLTDLSCNVLVPADDDSSIPMVVISVDSSSASNNRVSETDTGDSKERKNLSSLVVNNYGSISNDSGSTSILVTDSNCGADAVFETQTDHCKIDNDKSGAFRDSKATLSMSAGKEQQSSESNSVPQISVSEYTEARSESMTSVYSAAGGGRYGAVTVTGEILFGLSYNYKAGAMEIHIIECKDLAPVDTKRNRSDPYVKAYLLPDKTKSGKRKTKVKKHTLNPTFNEVLKFHVTISELETRTLWLTVWDSDRFGRNDFLGEVMLSLGYQIFDKQEPKWYALQERMEPSESPVTYKGDLIVSLKYVPPDVTSNRKNKRGSLVVGKGSLHLLVKEARNLMATRANGTSDPFCKSYLLPEKSKTVKQKTPVIRKNCNPCWNHTFVYDNVTLDDLKERCLELTIWDHDKITSNDFLGGVRLSPGSGCYQGREVDWMDSKNEEVKLWNEMLEKPNQWVDGSLLLRPSMQKQS
ncbi:SYTL5 (predicted) [Pycnogonum litorale]